jgi:hypothetical protein
MDYLASSDKLPFAAHGYAGYFLLATMDRHWKTGLSEAEGIKLAKLCVKELGACAATCSYFFVSLCDFCTCVGALSFLAIACIYLFSRHPVHAEPASFYCKSGHKGRHSTC